MANAVQRYAANKACCIATNVKKTDNKIKYGTEDLICCINKDFIANTFTELLMCNPISNSETWYRSTITGSFLDTAVTSFPTTVTFASSIPFVSSNGDVTGNFNLSNSTIVATDIDDFNTQMFDLLDTAISTDPSVVLEVVENSATGNRDIVIYFTSFWGNTTDTPSLLLSDFILSPSLGLSFTIELSTTTRKVDSCLTSSQLCDIKNWLDDYCQTC